MQVEQLRRSRLEAEDYKEQVADAQQQLRQQAHSLQRLQQQHQQLLDQLCHQSQRALEGSALHLHQHEGAALDQVGGACCIPLLPCLPLLVPLALPLPPPSPSYSFYLF